MGRLGRTTVLLSVLAIGVFSAWGWASPPINDVTLASAEDLRSESVAVQARVLPLLIEFSAKDCVFCLQLEEDFLKPMLRSGDYTERVIIRKIDITSDTQLTDFNGQVISAQALARRYGVKVTPTVVLLDAKGQELAERLIGVTTPDFYGGYLDTAIDESLQRLRAMVRQETESEPQS